MLLSARDDTKLAFFWAKRAPTTFRAPAEKQQNALAEALLFGRLTSLAGGPPITFRTAQDIGTVMGGRTYWKKFELQTDALGIQITHAADYDPLRGAAFFSRISDPCNAFPGTHFPERIRPTRNESRPLVVLSPNYETQPAYRC